MGEKFSLFDKFPFVQLPYILNIAVYLNEVDRSLTFSKFSARFPKVPAGSLTTSPKH